VLQFALYTIYMICGFVILWINLTLWGVTAGPVNILPYLSVVASLLLFVVFSDLALFFPRLASCGAVLAAVTMIPAPIWILLNEKDLSGVAMFGVPPAVSLCLAGIHLWCTRTQPFRVFAISPPLSLRIVLGIIPVAGFVLCFNPAGVLRLIFGV
jgi:hypothetical protein